MRREYAEKIALQDYSMEGTLARTRHDLEAVDGAIAELMVDSDMTSMPLYLRLHELHVLRKAARDNINELERQLGVVSA